MRKSFVFFSFFVLTALLLASCAPKAQPPAEPPPATQPPPPTQAPAAEQPTAEESAADTAPSEEAPASIQHASMPGELPEYTGLHMYDHNVIDGNGKLRSVNGDSFTHGQFERPYVTGGEELLEYLDIREATFYDADPTWMYVVITMVGTDSNNALPGKYGLEIDVDLSGKGTWLILVDSPSSAEWTTDRVQVWTDSDGSVGGVEEMFAEKGAETGNGYETLVFDQGQGDDPDAAWVRMNPDDPASFEIAFKKSLLGTEKYLISIWAGNSQLDPAMFDINDHMTHEQAGAMDPATYPDLVPIKGLSELDNTCRFEIGFSVASVKGACPPQ